MNMMRCCARPAFQGRRAGVLTLALVSLAACGESDEQTSDGNEGASTPSAELRGARGADAAAGGASGSPGEVPLTIGLSVESERADLTGTGKCTHAPEASIYGVPAALWQIQDSDAGKIRYASLTVWRPKAGGAEQFSMAINTAEAEHRIRTVKGGEMVGTGTVSIHPSGEGAHFEVVGTDADGRSVRATFQCARFTQHIAEGG
jgi:hypothetical protein